MSRTWRLSQQTEFESELVEALSLLLLDACLEGTEAARLIPREDLKGAKDAVQGLLEKFLSAYLASSGGEPGSNLQLTTRELTVWNAVRRSLIRDWISFRELLESAISWIARSRHSQSDLELDFLRRVEVVVASDLHSWYTRLRGGA